MMNELFNTTDLCIKKRFNNMTAEKILELAKKNNIEYLIDNDWIVTRSKENEEDAIAINIGKNGKACYAEYTYWN